MKNLIYIFHLLVISILSISCTSNLTNVRTSPEGATVYLVQKNNQKTRIGVTPINIPEQQLASSNEPNVQIRVEKEGYKPESYFIPRLLFSSYVDLSVQMQEEVAPPTCEVQSKNTSKVARNVAQAIFFTQQKKYDQAESLLTNLINENPDISVLYDLIGNVHYLNQKTNLAVEAYSRSLDLNPNSLETQRMFNKLKTIRLPAGENK